MRLLVLALAVVSTVLACSEEDPAPVYLEADYQVRCLDCNPRSADDAAREIRAIDGENDFSVACNAMTRRGARVVTFEASFMDPERESGNYSIRVVQAAVDADDPGTACRVLVSEGANSYEARCTGDELTIDEPCRVALELDGDVITGSIFCEAIPNSGNSSVTRHLVAPGTEDEPAEFEVHGCTGL